MTPRVPFAAVLTVAVLVQPLVAAAQSQQQTIYTSVVDRHGTPQTSLGPADFIVREDNTPREILAAAPTTDPLSIALLVDTSQAMEPYIANTRAAVKAFIQWMHGEHEIALFTVADRPTLLVDYTRDTQRLEHAAERVFSHTGSGAYLLDAISEVSDGLRAREEARKVIVVITSEGPEFSARHHTNVLDGLRDADVTLHSFVLTRRRAGFANDGAREREFAIARGSRLTGGRREDLVTSMPLSDRLLSLAAELSNQYRIVYSRPPSLLGPKKVEVALRQPGLIVRASRVPRRNATPDHD
jgi:Ca-activated chloride channel homolog